MKRSYSAVSLIFFLLISFTSYAQNPLPEVYAGKLERLAQFKSKYVAARNVDVWLPDGYSTDKEYPVLYMHDGQMLYDAKTTWNKQAWDVDEVASALIEEGKIRHFILVGVWNGGVDRHPDYYPQKPFESMNQVEQDTISAQLQRAHVPVSSGSFAPQSDAYLKFLVEELKPYIDEKYAVLTDRQNTYVAGSSMGGLISMYAICEYPEVFGGAACMSTHWLGSFTDQHNPAPASFKKYLEAHLPDPKTHKLYFDCGDQTLDQFYPEIQKAVDEILREKGYSDDSCMSRFFPGANHSEDAWNERLDLPLTFLLGD